MYDVNGVKTGDEAQAKRIVYTFTMFKRINGFSFNSYQVIPVGTLTSTISVVAPYD